MRVVGAIVVAVWSAWLFCQPAFADKRVALVIGNSAYRNVVRLANPANDSDAMATTFRSAGFDAVELKRDLTVAEMRRALRDFSDTARDADVAIVYFAGHGIEIEGTNYLIPVDAVLERDIDAFDEAIPLERILTVIEPARQLRLVILDACRDNPFNKAMKRTIGSRGVGRGLAKVEPESPNTLIAFAAKAGSTAYDGDSQNSPFTTALVKYLTRPGLDLRKAFGFARDDVLKATNNRQEPFIYGSLGGEDVALVPAPSRPAARPTKPGSNWRSGNRSRTTRTPSCSRPISIATRKACSRTSRGSICSSRRPRRCNRRRSSNPTTRSNSAIPLRSVKSASGSMSSISIRARPMGR